MEDVVSQRAHTSVPIDAALLASAPASDVITVYSELAIGVTSVARFEAADAALLVRTVNTDPATDVIAPPSDVRSAPRSESCAEARAGAERRRSCDGRMLADIPIYRLDFTVCLTKEVMCGRTGVSRKGET